MFLCEVSEFRINHWQFYKLKHVWILGDASNKPSIPKYKTKQNMGKNYETNVQNFQGKTTIHKTAVNSPKN